MRIMSEALNGEVYGNKFWIVGRFDDESGSSLKFFIAQGGEVEKIVFFDGEKVCAQTFKSKGDLSVESLEGLNETESKRLIDSLLDESLSQ